MTSAVISNIEADQEEQAYVRELERRADAEREEEEQAEVERRRVPTGDELEVELQRFLRELREREDEPGEEGEEGGEDGPSAGGPEDHGEGGGRPS